MSGLAVTMTLYRGEEGSEEVEFEEVYPATEYSDVKSVAKAFRINGDRYQIEFKFDPPLKAEQ